MSEELNDQMKVRIEKLEEHKNTGDNPYKYKFDFNARSNQLIEKYNDVEKDDFENISDVYKIAGRLVAKRGAGKASFCHIQDNGTKFQIYAREDALGDSFEVFKKLDIGDIIGLTGKLFKTNNGELTLRVSEFQLLTKSLRPLPEKFHGLTDVETRYRQRYLDLITNLESAEVFKKRSKIIKTIRSTLDELEYLEVETPILETLISGAAAKPFFTHHNSLDQNMNLRIATELPLKRLVAGGFDRVYEIGRIFRNEGISTRHNPEFTSIEFYEAYTDMWGVMKRTEDIIEKTCIEVNGTTNISYQDKEISLKAPFKKIHMVDIVKEETGIDFANISDIEEAKKFAKENDVEITKYHNTLGHVLYQFFDQLVESKIIEPTFVHGFPKETSPLAKISDGSTTETDRAELFILGREYANMYSELNDPFDQKDRFNNQLEAKELGDEETTDFDQDFIECLEYGMPPTGGCGIGIDRLVMLLTNSESIKDVILFPTLKK